MKQRSSTAARHGQVLPRDRITLQSLCTTKVTDLAHKFCYNGKNTDTLSIDQAHSKGVCIMPRAVHFELAAEDPERAVAFYRSVFDWSIEKWQGPMDYWLITTGNEGEPGIDGGLGPRQHPDEHTTNTIGVDSVDDYVAKVVTNGGTVLVAKHPIPGVGYLAYCADTEGNIFGLMSDDPTAR